MCVCRGKVNVAKWQQQVNMDEEYLSVRCTIPAALLWVEIFPHK